MPDLWLVALSPMNIARAVLQALPRLPVPGVSFTVQYTGHLFTNIYTHELCTYMSVLWIRAHNVVLF
jgi:hypothetical protein